MSLDIPRWLRARVCRADWRRRTCLRSPLPRCCLSWSPLAFTVFLSWGNGQSTHAHTRLHAHAHARAGTCTFTFTRARHSGSAHVWGCCPSRSLLAYALFLSWGKGQSTHAHTRVYMHTRTPQRQRTCLLSPLATLLRASPNPFICIQMPFCL